ncbi:signal peptide peptidase SppA [Orbaceae bacterium ESL0721]|nr:signal peptide peptidase SppA [Orbaceae bacterium ESL0721]
MFVIRTMKIIWKSLNFIRDFFFNLLFLIIILFAISGYYLIKSTQAESYKPQSGVLVVDLEGVIVDNTYYDDGLYQMINQLSDKKVDTDRENSLFILTQKIAQAAKDPNITTMVLKLDNFAGASLESLQYVGKYLTQFHNANKPIYAIGTNFNQSQYYLASYADKIYLTPQGAVALYGLSANTLYYKTLLDNLKVNTHVFRVGTYKSAIEPFIRDDMSNEARENTTRWLSLMWKNYVADVTDQRRVALKGAPLVPTADVMLAKLRDADGSMAQYALNNGVIDEIRSTYEFENSVLKQSDTVTIYDYILHDNNGYAANRTKDIKADNKPQIAVVFVNGTITDGNTSRGVTGSDDIVLQLRAIRQNPDIKAVVLRVNSPGGSVTASEAIRSELISLKDKDIPIIVSMGNMAASGGYWISTAADYIVANPNTITGSIGIFGIVPTFENTLAHVGVYSDGVATSPLAQQNLTSKLPDEMSQLIQMNINNGYHNFISLVAKSRKMELERVDKIAQGQVWLGQEALDIGLVDKLGDFDDAVSLAVKVAKLSDYRIDWQTPKTSWFSAMFSNMMTFMPTTVSRSVVGSFLTQLPEVKQLQQSAILWDKFATDPQNRYIYCLNCADVR